MQKLRARETQGRFVVYQLRFIYKEPGLVGNERKVYEKCFNSFLFKRLNESQTPENQFA